MTDPKIKNQFSKSFSARYAKHLKEMLNYWNPEAEKQGDHVIRQKSKFEKELYLHFIGIIEKMGKDGSSKDPIDHSLDII